MSELVYLNPINSNYNICIDFGTCNSVVSYYLDNNILHLEDELTGDVLIPTTIYFLSDKITSNLKVSDLVYTEHYLIGSSANELYTLNKDPEYYFYQFKRFLGITTRSNLSYIDFIKKFNLQYELDEDTIYFFIPCSDDNNIKLKLSVCDLIKLYFQAIYQMIKTKLSIVGQITCVITCPAYFHDLQRTQLKKASEDSGFIVGKIYNEPTVAAIYYINKYKNTSNSNSNNFIIYDLGGGTIDTTVVEFHESANTCEVIDIDGNNSLGGIDIDNLLIQDIYQKYQIDSKNIKWKNKIRKTAEEIKIKLTYQSNYSVHLESVPVKNSKGIVELVDNLKISYTRNQFNNLINDLIEQMIKPIYTMFEKYQTPNIIFIGGPTQIPILQAKVKSFLEAKNFINVSEQGIKTFESFEKNNNNLYKTIVSKGGSLLTKMIGEKEGFSLLDIIPMNIGISGPDDSMVVMIGKNSKIPLSVEKTFITSHDCQRTINIEVFEGINNLCSSNTFIGSYKIVGIPPLPKGMILIKLLFKISYNGILNISINGFKNPSDNSAKSFDFKMCENIKLISNMMAKDILRKLLQAKKSS